MRDADLQQASTVNALDTWKFLYDRKFDDSLIEQLQRNPQVVSWALSDPESCPAYREPVRAEPSGSRPDQSMALLSQGSLYLQWPQSGNLFRGGNAPFIERSERAAKGPVRVRVYRSSID
jgi:hypothetical protein